MKKLIWTLFIIICSFSAFAQNYVDGIVYLKFADDYPLHFKVDKQSRAVDKSEFPFLEEIFAKYGVRSLAQTLYLNNNPKLLRTLRVEFRAHEQVDMFIKELSQFKEIEYAEKLPRRYLQSTFPNDPYYGDTNFRWHLDMIGAERVWNELNVHGNPNVKIAIIDNAVWGNHPDLNIAPENLCMFVYNEDSVVCPVSGSANPPATVDQDYECSMDEMLGKDSLSCESYSWSHGTHCAGLVGAINDNNEGVASIGSGVTLMGVRSTDDDDEFIAVLEALQWAEEHDANIISLSLGGPESSLTELIIFEALHEENIIVVAAAGNYGDTSDVSGYPANYLCYPACYPHVISVAAVNSDGKLTFFSQYGEGRADIAAPGGSNSSERRVLSTTFSTTQFYREKEFGLEGVYYDGMYGTSMACPITAGLCGLLMSVYPDITPDEALECLQTTANPLTSGSNPIDGNGYINAYEAVRCAQSKNPDTPEPTNIAAHACGAVAIFPNPANNSFTIERPAATAQTAHIFDLAGKLLKTINCTETLTNVDVTDFASGIYFVKIENYTQKIIIQK